MYCHYTTLAYKRTKTLSSPIYHKRNDKAKNIQQKLRSTTHNNGVMKRYNNETTRHATPSAFVIPMLLFLRIPAKHLFLCNNL